MEAVPPVRPQEPGLEAGEAQLFADPGVEGGERDRVGRGPKAVGVLERGPGEEEPSLDLERHRRRQAGAEDGVGLRDAEALTPGGGGLGAREAVQVQRERVRGLPVEPRVEEGPARERALAGGVRALREPPEAAFEPRGLAAHANAPGGAEAVELELAREDGRRHGRDQEGETSGPPGTHARQRPTSFAKASARRGAAEGPTELTSPYWSSLRP